MIAEIRASRDRIESRFRLIAQVQDQLDLRLMALVANQMAMRCAGLVERSVQVILAEYALQRSSSEISRFVQRQVEWENSLNCDKIEKLLDRFNPTWWPTVKQGTSDEARLAVDSLKAIRDQLAHGTDNGTGIGSVRSYYAASSQVIDRISATLLPGV